MIIGTCRATGGSALRRARMRFLPVGASAPWNGGVPPPALPPSQRLPSPAFPHAAHPAARPARAVESCPQPSSPATTAAGRAAPARTGLPRAAVLRRAGRNERSACPSLPPPGSCFDSAAWAGPAFPVLCLGALPPSWGGGFCLGVLALGSLGFLSPSQVSFAFASGLRFCGPWVRSSWGFRLASFRGLGGPVFLVGVFGTPLGFLLGFGV
jgi:hypothetical protein